MDVKQKRRINLLLAIGIFVVVTIFYALNPADMVVLRVEDGTLIMEGIDDIRYEVAIDSIQTLEYVETPSYAENTKEPQAVICGSFVNENWGEHYLCVYSKVPTCIVAYAETGVYVFNCENADTTIAFYDALLKIL